MHQLLNRVCYATWHHTRAWENSSDQETFCSWDSFRLKWQSSEISRAVPLHGAAQRLLGIPVTVASWANSYGTSRWGTSTMSCACIYSKTYSKKHFVTVTVQLFGYDGLPIGFDHRHHWLLSIDKHVLFHLAFYLISSLISPWRLPIHRDIYSRSRRSLKAKTLLCPRLGHWRDEAEMKVISPKVLCSIWNQTFRLAGNCAKDQDLTTLLWWKMDRKS